MRTIKDIPVFRRSVFAPGRVATLKGMLMLFFALFSSVLTGRAQAVVPEMGLGAGVLNYAGDLSRGYNFSQLGFGVTGHYKLNFNHFIGVRFGLLGGMLRGSDQKPIDAFADRRDTEFSIALLEMSAVLEYNFLAFRDDKNPNRWSPYMFFGVGGFAVIGDIETAGKSRVQPNIPFGMGMRYALGKRTDLNIQAGVRKVFFDYLDGVSDGDITNKNYQYGNKYDDDWYNFIGISISYLIFEIPCPYDFY
jgi:hypothetical protein